jgi:LAO/AO transport system kinase
VTRIDAAAIIDGIGRGDRRSVARAISMVENDATELPKLSAALFPRTGSARTIGLTGSPGVGKSTLAARLVATARALGRSVAVLAIDPTSPLSGGALLGDRVRMQDHATDPGVYIRSMATRGHLGGMALAAPEAVRVLDAAGFDLVIVETVGVGQAELDVAAATDTTVVAVIPGWGDVVQLSKAGILEVADVFVVNKSDLDGANEAVRDLEAMIRLGGRPAWMPPVVKVAAAAGEGIDDLWAAIEAHQAHAETSGDLARNRARRLRHEVESLASELLRRRLGRALEGDTELTADLEDRRIDPYRAASALADAAART